MLSHKVLVTLKCAQISLLTRLSADVQKACKTHYSSWNFSYCIKI